jgi:hypothetical protein
VIEDTRVPDQGGRRRERRRKEALYMCKKTVAALLVDTLVSTGVKRIYGVAGDSLNGITDAIRTRDDIQWRLILDSRVVDLRMVYTEAIPCPNP